MKTETSNKILTYIKESGPKSPKELILYTNISAPALFRQLKKLVRRDLIAKYGKPPKVLYYSTETIKTVKINLSQFGENLSSRMEGREAYLGAKAYLLPKTAMDKVEINFTGVKMLGPGWADEFITPIKKEFGDNLILLPSENSSVLATLKTINLPQ